MAGRAQSPVGDLCLIHRELGCGRPAGLQADRVSVEVSAALTAVVKRRLQHRRPPRAKRRQSASTPVTGRCGCPWQDRRP